MADLIIVVLLLAALGGEASFAWSYHRRCVWWTTETGRLIMSMSARLVLLLAASVANNLFGPYPGRQFVVTVGLAAFVAVVIWEHSHLARAPRLWREHTEGRSA